MIRSQPVTSPPGGRLNLGLTEGGHYKAARGLQVGFHAWSAETRPGPLLTG
ncbi:MAG: hypothetical protein V9H26_06445 [Verrucomicrobiota bacterium]